MNAELENLFIVCIKYLLLVASKATQLIKAQMISSYQLQISRYFDNDY
jgi:hypothetical protein